MHSIISKETGKTKYHHDWLRQSCIEAVVSLFLKQNCILTNQIESHIDIWNQLNFEGARRHGDMPNNATVTKQIQQVKRRNKKERYLQITSCFLPVIVGISSDFGTLAAEAKIKQNLKDSSIFIDYRIKEISRKGTLRVKIPLEWLTVSTRAKEIILLC